MIFADLDLARRLERPEAVAGTRFVEAHRKISPESGAEWIDVGGVYAMFDGPQSPVTQTFGLGMSGEPPAADLDRLESFFFDRDAPVHHEVSPLAGIALAGELNRRGYRPIEFTSVLYQPLDPKGRLLTRAAPLTRLMVAGEEDLWARTMARGWADQPEFQRSLFELGRVLAAMKGVLSFFAELDGTPIATGVLHCVNEVALFGGASTVPEGRKQGAQSALFEARINIAISQGCDLAMIGAHPGSTSQRNAERQGFRIAYTRTKWQLPLTERRSG